MDLAARVLLPGHVSRIDLLTDEHLLPLYRSDQVFANVASRAEDLPADHDFVLLHSVTTRCLREKIRAYHRIPYAHVQGYYTGPEFNRTLFGFYRLAQLLRLDQGAKVSLSHARTSMWVAPGDESCAAALDIPAGSVCIALGGVRDWRTYNRWDEVIDLLKCQPAGCPPLVLVGSSNGLEMRDQLVRRHSDVMVIDRVDRHTLPEVFAVMQRCQVVLAADGGLLHVAQSACVPVVGLFAGKIHPTFRVTPGNQTIPLHGTKRVDDVEPRRIVDALRLGF